MKFFEYWKLSRKGQPASNFLAPGTWQNLKLCVYGFVGYARHTLENTNTLYIPILHSNTSAIEATFSSIQSLGGRNALSYESRVGCRSATDASTAVDKGRMYASSDTLADNQFQTNTWDFSAIQGVNNDNTKKQEEIEKLTISKLNIGQQFDVVSMEYKDVVKNTQYKSEFVRNVIKKIINKTINC